MNQEIKKYTEIKNGRAIVVIPALYGVQLPPVPQIWIGILHECIETISGPLVTFYGSPFQRRPSADSPFYSNVHTFAEIAIDRGVNLDHIYPLIRPIRAYVTASGVFEIASDKQAHSIEAILELNHSPASTLPPPPDHERQLQIQRKPRNRRARNHIH